MDCIFCKIVRGEIPAKTVHQDEFCIAFYDMHPQAPTHVLVIPREHIASLADAQLADAALLGHLLAVTSKLAAELGCANGFRTVINAGADGGQTVDHLHLHLLGGRPMHWPPG